MLHKLKHSGSQYCCTVLYLHWFVISVACFIKLKVFQCCERKNIRKIEEKKEEENYQIWIDFKPIFRPSKAKKVS